MDCILVFRLGRGSLTFLLNGHFRFTSDGECGMTHYRRFGVSGVATVRGRQVDDDATVIAEALEAAALPFLLRELAICPDAWIGAIGQAHWMMRSGCCPILLVQRKRWTACSDQRVWYSHPGIPSNKCCTSRW